MCLIYDHARTLSYKTRTGTLTLYKVYVKYEASQRGLTRDGRPVWRSLGQGNEVYPTKGIRSPFNSNRVSGRISEPGYYKAETSASIDVDGEEEWIADIGDFSDFRIGIAGFHCLLKREDAEKYARGIAPKGYACVKIVEITANVKDVIAAGMTPIRMLDIADCEMPELKLETLVLLNINISQEEFDKAVA